MLSQPGWTKTGFILQMGKLSLGEVRGLEGARFRAPNFLKEARSLDGDTDISHFLCWQLRRDAHRPDMAQRQPETFHTGSVYPNTKSWMDLETVIRSGVSQMEKHRNHTT